MHKIIFRAGALTFAGAAMVVAVLTMNRVVPMRFALAVPVGVVLFADDFDTGSEFGLWTSVDHPKWSVTNGDKNCTIHPGQQCTTHRKAEVNSDTGQTPDILKKDVSTAGYGTITLGYWYRVTQSLGDTDHVYVEWYDGSTWQQAADYTNLSAGAWASSSIVLLAGAENNPHFSVRWRANLRGGSDEFQLDDVTVTGYALPTGSISGAVFDDANANAARDSGESGLGNWLITATGPTTRTATSASDGTYTLSYLPDGTYTVCETVQSTWTQTAPPPGTLCVNGSNGRSVTVSGGGAATGADFGNVRYASLVVDKITDPSGDGQAFTFAVSGSGTSTSTEVRDADVPVAFENLLAGSYTVTETIPTGWDLESVACTGSEQQPLQIVQNGGAVTFDLPPGETVTCAFTDVKRGSITVNKIADPDSGSFDFVLSGTASASTSIASGGSYTFENLVPGGYGLAEQVPPEWNGTSTVTCSGGAIPSQLSLHPGENIVCTFNNTAYASIGGKVFHDSNANGAYDDESGLSQWTVRMTDDQQSTTSTLSDENGNYLFANVVPGNYEVCHEVQSGWYQSMPTDNQGCYRVTVVAGQNDADNDFGDYQKVSVAGAVFNDVDADGVWDQGELGLSGKTVTLSGPTPGTSDTRVTDQDGAYSFGDLVPGSYALSQTLDTGWVQTVPSPSSTYELMLFSQQSQEGLLFGAIEGGSVSGHMWWDMDADGSHDEPEESGLSGWVVRLDGTDWLGHAVHLETTSVEGGDFVFAGVPFNPSGLATPYRLTAVAQSLWERMAPEEGFDVYVESGGQTVTTSASAEPLKFGHVPYANVFDGRFALLDENPSSTIRVLALTTTTAAVADGQGTSTVIVPRGTMVTKNGEGSFDIALLTSTSVDEGGMSGFASGTVVGGALHWGVPEMGLLFDTPIQLSLFVGADLNGQTLTVQRSSSSTEGWTSDGINGITNDTNQATCVVANGACSFTATKASYYVAQYIPTVSPPAPVVVMSGGGGGGGMVYPNLTVPQGGFSVVINGGNTTTPVPYVVLALAGGPDAATMAISNTADFSGASQEPYATTSPWTLISGDGIKTVFARFYNAYGMSSPTVSSSIELISGSQTPPLQPSPIVYGIAEYGGGGTSGAGGTSQETGGGAPSPLEVTTEAPQEVAVNTGGIPPLAPPLSQPIPPSGLMATALFAMGENAWWVLFLVLLAVVGGWWLLGWYRSNRQGDGQ